MTTIPVLDNDNQQRGHTEGTDADEDISGDLETFIFLILRRVAHGGGQTSDGEEEDKDELKCKMVKIFEGERILFLTLTDPETDGCVLVRARSFHSDQQRRRTERREERGGERR